MAFAPTMEAAGAEAGPSNVVAPVQLQEVQIDIAKHPSGIIPQLQVCSRSARYVGGALI